MSTSHWIGKTLGGRYQIEGLLGQGGMSAVFKAMDPNLRRVVAVKIIHPHLSDNPEFVRRFEEEAAAVAQLRHPNIVQVYDFNHDDDDYFMVMEFVSGETLQARLRHLSQRGMRLSYPEAARIVANIADAIDYAHQRNMIHRDIKPANIMLNLNGQAILMDFGIAKILGGQQHTATGAVIGTALYMSPEQIRGERIDPRSDIYSLGVTLFEMTHGRPPFEADSTMSLMMMHLNDPLPDLRQLQPDAPESLVRVIERCLAKDPNQRYQTAAELAAALKRVAADLHGGLTPSVVQLYPPTVRGSSSSPYQVEAISNPMTPTPVASPATVAEDPAASTGSTTGVPPRRKWLAASGCTLAGLVVVCLAGAALLGSQFLGASGSSQAAVQALEQTQTMVAETRDALSTAVSARTETAAAMAAPLTPTFAPTVESPTQTPPPTSAPDPNQPTPIPPGMPYVLITGIELDGDHYIVNYETLAFFESLSGQHIHFFFNTTSVEDAGVPGKGPYIMHGGPRPFREISIFDTPPDATQMCALVANVDHTITPGSGNCFDLPAPAGGIPTPTAPAVPPTPKPDKDPGGYDY